MSERSDDIGAILRAWPHERGRLAARLIEGADGRPKVQVRLDLGLLQMELDGRPDGRRPEGAETLFDHLRQRMAAEGSAGASGSQPGDAADIAAEVAGPTGAPGGTGGTGGTGGLSEDDCRGLREEAVQIYHRYVALFSIGEYERVIRDTRRNLRVFDFCRAHARRPEDAEMLEQFRPSVIAMQARAEAEEAVARREPREAVARLDAGLDVLRRFFEDHVPPERLEEAFDRSGEAQLLRGMRDALVPKLPASQRAELEERLRAALDAENYELAAILRDELRMM